MKCAIQTQIIILNDVIVNINGEINYELFLLKQKQTWNYITLFTVFSSKPMIFYQFE